MNSMHKTVFEIMDPRCVLISVGYIDEILKDQLIWEQEVVRRRRIAPTSLLILPMADHSKIILYMLKGKNGKR